MRILVVEDNDSLAALLAGSLGRAGFAVDCVATLADAGAAAAAARYDAVILDRSLPDGDGLALIAGLRRKGIATPVLILSARDRVEDRIQGLNAGADDYLPKPFAFDELTARLNALLRRPAVVLPTCVVVGNVSMDDATQEVEVAGRKLDLPRRERALLRIFVRSGGRLVSRATLEEALFGFNEEVGSNAIEVYVHRLRKRLEGVGATAAIHTERGIGYRFTAAEFAAVKAPSLLRELASDLMVAHLVAIVVIVMLVVQVLGTTVTALESRDMREVAADVVGSLAAGRNGTLQLDLPARTAARFSPSYGRYIYAVLDSTGRILMSSTGMAEPPVAIDAAGRAAVTFQSRHGSVWLFGVTLRGMVGTRPVWVEVAENMNHRDVLMDEVGDAVLLRVVWGVVPVYVVLVAIALMRMKRRLRPLLLVSAEAARIGPAATGIRLPDRNVPKEVRPLVAAVNTGLARLEHAFAAQREFLEDAAHELRTPLTVLRARIEATVDPAVRPPLLDDITIISRTVTQLLRVAELEGIGAEIRETVDIAALGRAIAAYLTPMAAAEGKAIVVRGPDSLPYPGNSEALGQAISNLVENALFHTPAGTEVDIVLAAGPGPTITVRDRGPGVPAHERGLIFQRFWRRDRRRGSGAGLGLSIVGRAVELHGGHVAVGDAEGGGAVFTITLPPPDGAAANGAAGT